MSKSESFGLKEVADVMLIPLTSALFYDDNGVQKMKQIDASADNTGKITYTVKDPSGTGSDIVINGTGSTINSHYLFDSLKVSNIEMSSEDTSARGGKGNPELISWSYGKEVTFTMEDALLNLATLHLMFGAKEGVDADGSAKKITSSVNSLTIDANTFPTNYLLIGTTVLRSYLSGKDDPFVFIIPKAKINATGTLTMEADGDPSTFEMTVKALAQDTKDGDSVLVQFKKLTVPTL